MINKSCFYITLTFKNITKTLSTQHVTCDTCVNSLHPPPTTQGSSGHLHKKKLIPLWRIFWQWMQRNSYNAQHYSASLYYTSVRLRNALKTKFIQTLYWLFSSFSAVPKPNRTSCCLCYSRCCLIRCNYCSCFLWTVRKRVVKLAVKLTGC